MQQFVVPQFIDVEDKILGPITVRQFVILLSDGLFLALCYKLADLALFIILTVIFGGLGVIFSFVKVNGQPFHYFVLNFLQTSLRPAVRVWNKNITGGDLKRSYVEEKSKVEPPVRKQTVTASRLSEMSLVVDTGGRYLPEE